ncbi:Trm112 family protein [Arenibaculum pallidiluteum]|uniref:Trm112 family protein n=1 Tax=Arenibaculum pallidiluteum TaxID=2812559 RepID=UPI001A97AA47|nr:Trm112 family protein [Arenibaculum pallidiluteum]
MTEPGRTEDQATPPSGARVDPKLLEILVCPLTKGPLRYDAEHQELISDRAHLAYPIRDGVPIMLVDEARRLDGEARDARP